MANSNYSLIPTEVGKKVSNWDKPGGSLGLFVAVVLGGLGIWGLYSILPFIITLLQNIFYAFGLGVLLVAIGIVLSSKSFRENVSMAYFILMRKIAGILIEVDPIAIVEHKIMEMRDKIDQIRQNMAKINGLIKRNEARVADKKVELENELLKLKEFSKNPEKAGAARVAENQVKRLRDSIARAKKRLDESKQWYEILKKLKGHAELVVEDTENEVNNRKEEYEAIKAQHAAFSSITSVLKGNPNEMVNFTRAMDYMADDIAFRLGEMSDVIDETGGLLDQIEVDDAITSARAAEILAQYEQGGIESLFTSQQDVKAIEGKRTDFGVTLSNTEEQEPVMVERNEEKPVEKRTYFS